MKQQTIVVVLNLKEEQAPYKLTEGPNSYEALRHFFEDIDYEVVSIETQEVERRLSSSDGFDEEDTRADEEDAKSDAEKE